MKQLNLSSFKRVVFFSGAAMSEPAWSRKIIVWFGDRLDAALPELFAMK